MEELSCFPTLGKGVMGMGLAVSKRELDREFPGGTVVKNLPANAGDMGSSPGPGRSHMLQSS